MPEQSPHHYRHLKNKWALTGDLILDFQKCQRGDLNSRPQGYESCALTS